MEPRNVERFRKRAIFVHWLHVASFVVLLITGALMFFDLTSMSGGQQIRTIHKVAAGLFVAVPVLFILFDPKAAMSFLREAFHWSHDDLIWLKASISYYFGRKVQMPPQGYINGDQRLWQLIVIITGLIFALSGILMWFFKLKMPLTIYQGLLLAHATAFWIVLLLFLAHVYLTTLQRRLGESLSSMVDGKVSSSFAREHYGKWYSGENGKEASDKIAKNL